MLGEGQYCVPNDVPACRQGFVCSDNICRRDAQTPEDTHRKLSYTFTIIYVDLLAEKF